MIETLEHVAVLERCRVRDICVYYLPGLSDDVSKLPYCLPFLSHESFAGPLRPYRQRETVRPYSVNCLQFTHLVRAVGHSRVSPTPE